MPSYKPGGEVDAFCTRCKLLLAHTIVAVWAQDIKRVRCNTCMGEHAYRSNQPSAASAKPAKPRASAPAREKAQVQAQATSYVEQLQGKDRSKAKRYSPKEKLELGDLVEHPSFGLGVVAAARGVDKADVQFPEGVKTLAHSKGGAPAFLAKPLSAKKPDVQVEEAREADPAAETSDE